MKIKLYITVALLVPLIASGCGSQFAGESDEVIILDSDLEKSNSDNDDEITFFDSDFAEADVPSDSKVSKKRETTEIDGNDNSTISTSYDGVGNKIETRIFKSHSRVRMVKVTTSVHGKIRVFVYAQTGEATRIRKRPPESMLSGTGDEIANIAGIYESVEQKERREAETAKSRAEQIKIKQAEIIRDSAPVQPDPVQPEVPQPAENKDEDDEDGQKEPPSSDG